MKNMLYNINLKETIFPLNTIVFVICFIELPNPQFVSVRILFFLQLDFTRQ